MCPIESNRSDCLLPTLRQNPSGVRDPLSFRLSGLTASLCTTMFRSSSVVDQSDLAILFILVFIQHNDAQYFISITIRK